MTTRKKTAAPDCSALKLEARLSDLRKLFAAQRFAVLGTYGDHMPYSSLVAFAETPNLRRLLFATARNSQKYRNLHQTGRASLLIDNRSNQDSDLQKATAVSAVGSTREVFMEERASWRSRFLAKHPSLLDFIDLPQCAWLWLEVETYTVVTQFGNVSKLKSNTEGFFLASHP